MSAVVCPCPCDDEDMPCFTAPNAVTCTEMPANEGFLGPVFDLGAEIDAAPFASVTEERR